MSIGSFIYNGRQIVCMIRVVAQMEPCSVTSLIYASTDFYLNLLAERNQAARTQHETLEDDGFVKF